MLNKYQITKKLLETLSKSDTDVYVAMQHWWQDFREDSGMRLTTLGYEAFEQAWDLEKYLFDIPPGAIALPRQLIILNRKLHCPYYIKLGKKPKLILFDDQQAVMLALYGDFLKFIDYLERS